ncbi:type II toxin-antitoxin system RelE/ParE family toxin [Rhizobium sp. 18065]|uniref:type II toxin-antitoxin system RelE/ParE family toxin n=1 Tax=Rhizobium sp. 18065 TaxID=2681411 RepID=UPI001359A5BF|nr:type II toxin-antitoxin system RelE/ParE family toxin [Rhizobium sp. 18065]
MAQVRLSQAARADIVDILMWTSQTFGEGARLRYERLLGIALRNLSEDPLRLGTVERPELGDDIRSYHLRHAREWARLKGVVVQRPRHLLLYRIAGTGMIGIGRILHDTMELERHRPRDYGDG